MYLRSGFGFFWIAYARVVTLWCCGASFPRGRAFGDGGCIGVEIIRLRWRGLRLRGYCCVVLHIVRLVEVITRKDEANQNHSIVSFTKLLENTNLRWRGLRLRGHCCVVLHIVRLVDVITRKDEGNQNHSIVSFTKLLENMNLCWCCRHLRRGSKQSWHAFSNNRQNYVRWKGCSKL